MIRFLLLLFDIKGEEETSCTKSVRFACDICEKGMERTSSNTFASEDALEDALDGNVKDDGLACPENLDA